MPDLSKAALDALVASNLRESPPAISAPESEKKGVSKWAQLAMLAGHGIDAGTTIHALNNGAEEANPIYGKQPSAGKVLGIKAGSAALQALMQHFIGKKSPGVANALGYGTGAALGAVGINNMINANKSNK